MTNPSGGLGWLLHLEQTTRRGVTHDVEGRQSGADAAQGALLLSERPDASESIYSG